MNIKYILKGLIATLLLSLAFTSCDSYNEMLSDGIGNTREFSPIGLKANIRNQTTVELNWTVKAGENDFVIEFSADDPTFKTIFKTLKVNASQLPVQVALEGETVYSIRVKTVTPGLDDSKWSVVTATTLSEQIFLPIVTGDIDAKKAVLRWTANSNVTQIVLIPGNITHTITPAEKVAGIATVTGLTAETPYTATLLNGTKKRGTQTFTTGIDIGTGILVTPTDNLFQKIADAPTGSVLVLLPGDYTAQTDPVLNTSKLIILDKSITLRGLRTDNKPKLSVNFTVTSGVGNLSLIDLNITGPGTMPGANASLITISGAAATYNDILISGCNIHDFERSLFTANITSAKVNSLTVENSIIKNVNTNAGADFIDFRNTYIANIILKNSTFDTCSIGRDFVRVDAASGLSGTGLTTNVSIDKCTLYKVSNTSAPKRILYVRFLSNTSSVKNTLITDTSAIYSNQSTTTTPVFSTNYYYNAPSFMDATLALNKPDTNGITANPQFVNAAGGDFTVKNQTLIDNKIGDPQWLK